MLAHPYGNVIVMSSYYFTDNNAGPPSVPANATTCMDNKHWVCEHRWGPIANMVAFRNTAGNNSMTNFYADTSNYNHIAFSRGAVAWVAMNRDTSSWTTTLQTNLPAGSYCNVISSSACQVITVGSNGKATVTVPTLSAVAIHINKMYNPAVPTYAVTVQMFQWSWDSIAKECETFLGPMGYKAVQVCSDEFKNMMNRRCNLIFYI